MSISRPICFKPVLWKPIQVDYLLQYFSIRYQCLQIGSEASLLTRISKKKYLDFCIGKVWTYLLKEIYYKILSMHLGGKRQGLKDDQVPSYKSS